MANCADTVVKSWRVHTPRNKSSASFLHKDSEGFYSETAHVSGSSVLLQYQKVICGSARRKRYISAALIRLCSVLSSTLNSNIANCEIIERSYLYFFVVSFFRFKYERFFMLVKKVT